VQPVDIAKNVWIATTFAVNGRNRYNTGSCLWGSHIFGGLAVIVKIVQCEKR